MPIKYRILAGVFAGILMGLASVPATASDTTSTAAEIEAMKKNAAPRPAASAVKQKEVMSGWSYAPREGVTYDTGRYYLNLTADLIGSVM